MEKIKKPRNKTKYIGFRVDPDTDAMFAEVALAEQRSRTKAIIRLARMGYSQWAKLKKSHNNAYF